MKKKNNIIYFSLLSLNKLFNNIYMIPKIIELLSNELSKDENKQHLKNFLGPVSSYINFYFYILLIILFFILITSTTSMFFIYRLVIREKLLTQD